MAEIQELRRDQMKSIEGTEKQHQQLLQLHLQQTQSFENEIERLKKELQSSKMVCHNNSLSLHFRPSLFYLSINRKGK